MSIISVEGPQQHLERLRDSSHVRLIVPGDADFDEARLAWNRAHEHHPLAVAVPSSTQGVVEVVLAARESGLAVAIQSTGHGPTRVADGAILLDLSELVGVSVDAAGQRATVGGGAKWQHVLDAVVPHGLAPLLGSTPDVGVVGYVLGGGVGWFQRAHGTAADAVRRFELVTAQGVVLEVTEASDPELWWALRGAGAGHLGVVTAVEIDLFPITEVYGGNLLYPAEMAVDVMRRWRDWTQGLPASMTSAVLLMNYPPLPELPPELSGQSFAIVRGVHVGPTAEGERLLDHWRSWRAPTIDGFTTMPVARIAEVSQDPVDPLPGLTVGWWMKALSDAAIDELVATTYPHGGPGTFIFSEIRHTARVPQAASESLSEAARDGAPMLLDLVALTPTVDDLQAARAAAGRLRSSISADLTGRHYLNFVEGDQRRFDVAGAVGHEAVERLAALKRRLDPERRFDHGLDVLA